MMVLHQSRDDVAGRRAEDISEDEHAVAGVDVLEELARAQHEVVRVVLAPDRERGHLQRRAAQDLARAREHRGADLAMRDQQYADHFILASSAVTNIPETSNPVWSW